MTRNGSSRLLAFIAWPCLTLFAQTDLIVNGSFELGLSSWSQGTVNEVGATGQRAMGRAEVQGCQRRDRRRPGSGPRPQRVRRPRGPFARRRDGRDDPRAVSGGQRGEFHRGRFRDAAADLSLVSQRNAGARSRQRNRGQGKQENRACQVSL